MSFVLQTLEYVRSIAVHEMQLLRKFVGAGRSGKYQPISKFCGVWSMCINVYSMPSSWMLKLINCRFSYVIWLLRVATRWPLFPQTHYHACGCRMTGAEWPAQKLRNFVRDLSVPLASLSARRSTKSDGKDGRVTRVSAVKRKAANHGLCFQTLKLFLFFIRVLENSCRANIVFQLRFTDYNSMFSWHNFKQYKCDIKHKKEIRTQQEAWRFPLSQQ